MKTAVNRTLKDTTTEFSVTLTAGEWRALLVAVEATKLRSLPGNFHHDFLTARQHLQEHGAWDEVEAAPLSYEDAASIVHLAHKHPPADVMLAARRVLDDPDAVQVDIATAAYLHDHGETLTRRTRYDTEMV